MTKMAEEIQKTLDTKKTSERIYAEENVLWQIFLDREHKLCLQIRKNKFLFFSLSRTSLDRNRQVVSHSVFLSLNQLKVLYENTPSVIDNFRKLQHERGLK